MSGNPSIFDKVFYYDLITFNDFIDSPVIVVKLNS